MKNWLINLGLVLSVIVISISLWNLQITDTYLMKEIDRLGSVPVPISVNNIQDVINQVMQSVVYIRVNGENGWGGSGVYVGNGLIMTARHLIKEGTDFVITFENGEEYVSGFALADLESDVAFISICSPSCESIKFNLIKSRRGDLVYVLGNPYGLQLKFSVTKGIVSALDREHDKTYGNKLVTQIDAPTYPGDSGCPVVNSQGEMIGMVVGTAGNGDNTGMCIPADVCKQALEICLGTLGMKELK